MSVHARSLAGLGLPGGATGPARPLDAETWRGLLELARREGLIGVLADAVAGGTWVAPPDQVAEAEAAHRAAMVRALLIDRRLSELAPALDDAGVRWRVLGGPATAHLDEADPARRSYERLDLLVRGDDVATVLHLLAGLGGRPHGDGRRQLDGRFGAGVRVTMADDVELRIRRSPTEGPFGLVLDPRLLLDAEAATFPLGALAVPALPAPARFLVACYRSALEGARPGPAAMRDVALTFPDDDAGARRTHRLARAAGAEAVVATAVRDTAAALAWSPTGPLARWAEALVPNRRDGRWLAAHRGPGRSSSARAVLALEALDDPADRLAYVRAVLDDLGPASTLRRLWEARSAAWATTSLR